MNTHDRMVSRLSGLALMFWMAVSAAADEDGFTVPWPSVTHAFQSQIFVGPNRTAQVLEGKNACNVLTLSEPRLQPAPDGRVRFVARMVSRSGTPLTKGRCLPLFAWDGMLEAIQIPILADDGRSIRFRVEESRALNAEGEPSTAPGVIFGWVRKKVHPRLESARIDLEDWLREPLQILAAASSNPGAWQPGQRLAQRVNGHASGLQVSLVAPARSSPLETAGVSQDLEDIESLERWRKQWQALDAFLTWLVLQSAKDATAKERVALFDALNGSRHVLSAAVAEGGTVPLVEKVLSSAYAKLNPVLLEIAGRQSADRADRIGRMLFVLAQLAGPASPHSFSVDEETLGGIIRLWQAAPDPAALHYLPDINPELRRLAGFSEQFPLAGLSSPPWFGLDLLISPAYAGAQLDSLLVQKLNGWVPDSTERAGFHTEVDTLLRSLASSFVPGRTPESGLNFLRTVAWEASCWRQFRMEAGRVQPTRGPRGELGILRVDPIVSRGLHDAHGLAWDIGYNLRAGAEWLRRETARYPANANAEQVADLYLSYRGKTGGDSKNVRTEKARFIASFRHFEQSGGTPPPVCEHP